MLRFTVCVVLLMLRVLLVGLVWVRVWAVIGLFSGVGCLCSQVAAGRLPGLCKGGCAVGGVGRW